MSSILKPQRVGNQGFQTKLLPYTPFVSSWPYRTDIFSITRWENRPKSDTWLQEVEQWKQDRSLLTEDLSELINKVAKMVDNLEQGLQTNPRLQNSCGFGRKGNPAPPIGTLKPQLFLPTNLLDVLLWSAFDDTEVTSRKLTFNIHHRELGLENPWHPPPNWVAHRFVDFSGERIDSLTNQFLDLFHSTLPTYLPAGHIPTGSLSAVGIESSNTPPPQEEVQEHPSKWLDGQTFLAHASTAASAMNSKAAAHANIVSCNMWVLVSSLIFLIKSQDKEYGQRFAQANSFMSMDSRTKEMLEWYFVDRGNEGTQKGGEHGVVDEGQDEREEEEGEEEHQDSGIQPKGKGQAKIPKKSKDLHFTSERLVLAAAALCHSPIFVLDPLVDLSRQNEPKMVPYHALSLRNILSGSFDPLSTNTRATATEKALWKLIVQTMAECLGSRALTRQISQSEQQLFSEMAPLLHGVLKDELKKTHALEPSTQEFIRLDWRYLSLPDEDNTIPSVFNVVGPASAEPVLRRSTRESAKKTGSQGRAANKGKGKASVEHTGQEGQEQGNEDDDMNADITEVRRDKVVTTPIIKPPGEEHLGEPDEPDVTILEDDEEEEDEALSHFSEEVDLSLIDHQSSSRSKPTRVPKKPRKSKSRSQKKVACKPSSNQERHVEIQSGDEGTSVKTQQLRVAKRVCVHFEDDDEVQSAVKKRRKVEQVSDTTYAWTTHVDIKLERAHKLQPVPPESPQVLAAKNFDFTPIWEDDLVKDDQDESEDDSKISVIRHVLLPDGTFHRESITFTVAWPDNYCQKLYFWSLLKNSRPAEVSEGYGVLGGEKSLNNMDSPSRWHRSILPLSYFDCLESRKLNPQELDQRELLLASSPLLILRPRTREAIRDAYTLPILDSEDIWKNLYVNVWLERQVHDTRKLKRDGTFKHLRAGSIQKVINRDRRAMNMLDIPNPNLTLPNFIRKLSLDSLGGPLTEGAGFPFTTMKWNLCATQPAVTDLHYDSGKVATWIHMHAGTKIWFVLDGDIPEKGLSECDPKDLKFVYYVLEEGSIFTMPPGTVHAVLNVTDCFAEGGHMFLRHGLHRSFDIGLREHIHALQDTNTIHTQAEAVLHGIWTHFYVMIVSEHEWIKGSLLKQRASNQGNITYQSLREKNNSLPPTEDMVALLCMCVHAMAFEPQVGKIEQNPCPESIKAQRIQSRERAEECIFWINDLWEPLHEYENKISTNLKKSPFNIQTAGIEYVINPMIDHKAGRPKKGPIPHVHRDARGIKKSH